MVRSIGKPGPGQQVPGTASRYKIARRYPVLEKLQDENHLQRRNCHRSADLVTGRKGLQKAWHQTLRHRTRLTAVWPGSRSRASRSGRPDPRMMVAGRSSTGHIPPRWKPEALTVVTDHPALRRHQLSCECASKAHRSGASGVQDLAVVDPTTGLWLAARRLQVPLLPPPSRWLAGRIKRTVGSRLKAKQPNLGQTREVVRKLFAVALADR